MTEIEKLEKYGATEIESYCLISNYGYRFKIDGIKYDIRFWANCYGVALDRWSISPCTQGEDGRYIQMPKELQDRIETDFNEA